MDFVVSGVWGVCGHYISIKGISLFGRINLLADAPCRRPETYMVELRRCALVFWLLVFGVVQHAITICGGIVELRRCALVFCFLMN